MVDSLVRILASVDRGIAWIERAALAVGVLGMTFISVANVLMRNLADQGLVFANEINMALIILVTFLGVGYAARQGRHIRMTALYDQFGRRVRKVLMVVMALTTSALLFVLAFQATRYAVNTWQIGSVTPALRIPLGLIYTAAPIGLALGGVQYLLTALRNIFEHDVYESFAHKEAYDDTPDTGPERI